MPGFDCSNPIDGALLPILVKEGVTPLLAGDAELCRRYGIDLSGVAPSFGDYEQHCRGKTPAQMVDHFMQSPAYLIVNQRVWADAFLYDNRHTWYRYITDLDALVGSLYQGALRYPNFVAVAVAHPAFISKFQGENAIGSAYQNFLGRDASPDERQDMLALYRMWRERTASDPALAHPTYNACTDGSQCDPGRTCTNGYCTAASNYTELYVDPEACAGSLGAAACTSAMTGASVVLPGTGPLSLDQLTPDQWEILRTPGRVLAGLPGFWEAACDAVLRKYTGWWAAGDDSASHQLPPVRASLAAFFESSGGDVRKLERAVLTSAIYTMQGRPEDPNDWVYWHHGPTKQLTAETWLDSVGAALGVDLGSCDRRYPNTSARWLPPELAPPPGQLAGFSYAPAARILGGCPDHLLYSRAASTGVLVAVERREVLAAVCASAALAGAPDPQTLVRQFWRRALLQDPTDDQASALAASLPGSDSTIAVSLCQVLPRTNPFLFY